jgi:hypothetical protein
VDNDTERSHPGDGPGLRQGDTAHLIVPSAGWQWLLDLVSKRGLAGLQHAAERARGRIHRSLRPTDRLRQNAGEAVLDGEPIYEDHPVRSTQLGHSTATDVRRPIYWDLFSKHATTYSHHSVLILVAGQTPINNPLMPWSEASTSPARADAARQESHALAAFLARVPDDSVIVPDRVPTAVRDPGIASWRDPGGSCDGYMPVGRKFKVLGQNHRAEG